MNAKTFLILSLALNVALGLYIVKSALPNDRSAGIAGRKASGNSPGTESGTTKPVEPAARESTAAGPSQARTFNWEMVESPDYREYIANLRSIGCPEETIRDIIIADVNKLYAAKKRELRGEPKEFEYWKAGMPWMGQVDADYLASVRQLEKEKFGVLRQLGIEPDVRMQMNSLTGATDTMGSLFGFLPEEKQVRVMQVMQDMQAELAEAAQDGGDLDPAAMMEMQKRMEATIQTVLTPDEYRDYELRMSLTANSMRSQLAGWDPDEQEFLEVFELRKAFDDEFSVLSRGNETEEETRRREQAEQQLSEAIREAIGDDRYKAYERAQDWGFQQIYQAAQRADLGTEEAVQVYEMREVALQEVENVRADPTLTEEQRNAALAGIRAETTRSMQDVLGEEGWSQYDRGVNTYWLNNLVP